MKPKPLKDWRKEANEAFDYAEQYHGVDLSVLQKEVLELIDSAISQAGEEGEKYSGKLKREWYQRGFNEGKKVIVMEVTKEEIMGALARGYCHKETEDRILDADLIQAMAEEVELILKKND